METTIDILKEILYHTEVGENDRYAEVLVRSINKLEDIYQEPLVSLIDMTNEIYDSIESLIKKEKECYSNPDSVIEDYDIREELDNVLFMIADILDNIQKQYKEKGDKNRCRNQLK